MLHPEHSLDCAASAGCGVEGRVGYSLNPGPVDLPPVHKKKKQIIDTNFLYNIRHQVSPNK